MDQLWKQLCTLMFSTQFLLSIVNAEYGFVQLKSLASIPTDVCAAFNSEFQPFPVGVPSVPWGDWHQVVSIYPDEGCSNTLDNYHGKIVIVKRGNCTFAEKAIHVSNAHGIGLLVVSNDGLLIPAATAKEFHSINISVAIITEESFHIIIQKQQVDGAENVKILQYTPEFFTSIDLNLIVMWLLAVFTCAIGASFQGQSFNRLHTNTADIADSKSSDNGEELDLDVTLTHSILYFGFSSVSILMMYFFFDYLVYVVIVIFCYVSALSMFNVLYVGFKYSPCLLRCRLFSNQISFLKRLPSVFEIVLFVVCAAFSIAWAIYRKSWFAWIMQDILGVAFCIYMIKTIKLPSFKVCTLLLVLFFLYDIFYVFITPLFTSDKESIMVHVATGGTGKTKEELPMLFKLPKFPLISLRKCVELPYSMLGYGDVILPGLHVGFCSVWDSKISAKSTLKLHSYYLAAILGYGIGLIITFLGMYVMKTGQPALLYLVPCCLLSTLFVAMKRNELADIWVGRSKRCQAEVSKAEYKKATTQGTNNEETKGLLGYFDADTVLVDN